MSGQGGQGTATSEIADLRRRLRADEVSFLDKYAGRIDAIERARPWFVVGGVVGAAVIGFGRFIEGTPGIVVSTVGIAAALIFGGLVGWADFKKLEISREARNAMSIADDALDRAARYATALDEQTRRRGLREERLKVGALLREAIASAVASGFDMGDAIDSMLDSAKLRLVAACDFDAAEYWALTIFSLDEEGVEMEKMAALWNDATTSAGMSRRWRKGEGFTGVAWRNERAIVVPDMTAPGMADEYPVPGAKHRDHDRQRYRSAASYPVVVDGAVWGIVTATSDRPSRFDLGGTEGAESARVIQDVASHVALLATVERYAVDR